MAGKPAKAAAAKPKGKAKAAASAKQAAATAGKTKVAAAAAAAASWGSGAAPPLRQDTPQVRVREEELSSGAQKRRLGRRDTEEAVDRAMEQRLLNHFPKSVVEGAVDFQGRRVREVVALQIRDNRYSRKRLNSSFWLQLIKDFKLSPSMVVDELPDPPADETSVAEELLEKIGMAHADNPAARSPEPLERYLDHCGEMRYIELYGVIKASMEGPRILHSASVRLLLATLKYIARVRADLKYPEMWRVMSDRFDQVLAESFESAFAKNIPRLSFLRAHRSSLMLFIGEHDFAVFENALNDKVNPPLLALQRAQQASRCVTTMFAEAAKQLDYQQFLQSIGQRLNDLEYNDYSPAQVRDFKTMMVRSTQALVAGGLRSFQKKEVPIGFLGGEVSVVRCAVDDDWEFRYHARIKTVALNVGSLKLLPWESLLLTPGAIPGALTTVQLDASLLGDYANCRDAVLHVMGTESMTFAEMRRVVGSHAKAWLNLDRSFALEISYLSGCAEKLALEQIHRAVLEALPSENGAKTCAASILALHQVKASAICRAAGATVVAEVEGVHTMVASLDDGVGVQKKDLANFSPFYKTVVARLPYYLKREETTPSGSMFKRTLLGRPALLDLYTTLATQKAQGGQIAMRDLQPLRTYRWLLTDEQDTAVTNWVQSAACAHATLLSRMAIGDGPPETIDVRSIVLASASSSSGLSAPKKRQTKTGAGEESVGGAAKKDLMHFFVGKSQ